MINLTTGTPGSGMMFPDCFPPVTKTEPASALAVPADSGQAGGTATDASVAILQTQTPVQTAIAKPSLVAVLEFAGYVDHSAPVSAFQGTPQISPLAFSPRVPSLHPAFGNGALSDSSCFDLTELARGVVLFRPYPLALQIEEPRGFWSSACGCRFGFGYTRRLQALRSAS